MIRVSKGLFVVAGSVVLGACGAPAESSETGNSVGATSAALGAEETTTTRVVFVCNESTAFDMAFDVTHPATVAPSESFPVTIHFKFLYPLVTPYSGTIASSEELLTTAATPASQAMTIPPFHFPQGVILSDIGDSAAAVTASSTIGAPVVLGPGAFDYTITPDSPGAPGISAHCIPPADQASLATIPIVKTPANKDDCKGGGWQSLTDDAGNAFKNQGRCVSYAEHQG